MRVSRILFTILITAFITSACQKNKLNIDVSNIEVNIDTARFDRLLFGNTLEHSLFELNNLNDEQSYFFQLFTQNIIRIGNSSHPEFQSYLEMFIVDSINQQVADSVFSVFPSIHNLHAALTDAFKHYKYYFPEKSAPHIYTYVLRFNQPILIANDILGIGLDQYLGANCSYYKYLGIPEYKRENMYPEKITTDAIYAWALTEYPENLSGNLLEQMIYQGKLLYFTEAMCPATDKAVIAGFPEEKLKWCQNNEAAIWSYLIEKKYLYNRERMTIQRFIGNAPYTNVFGQQSPGRTAAWVGWQIVKSYMNEHPEVTIKALMEENNHQKILNFSKYHPK